MLDRKVNDWSTLIGANVEIRRLGATVCSGVVDAVTGDGGILWVLSAVDGRRLFEKTELYQVWAVEERVAFHYEVTRAETSTPAELSSEALPEGAEYKSAAAA